MVKILKPIGTSRWLLRNYPKLTLKQISDFCSIDFVEVMVIKNQLDKGVVIAESNPVFDGYVSIEELNKASEDNSHVIKFLKGNDINFKPTKRTFIPIIEKQKKNSAIFWLIRNYENITDEQIKKLTKSSYSTIKKVKGNNFYPPLNINSPLKLGLCSKELFEEVLNNLKNTN
ncbi:hypothetical protein AB836_00895 [Rickettsiales bacterium (ex Bugula neritina AB1)]|nr:hypothetical protein AB836_00895 [Rickettsiales bacterium (ex Bugula neritina AB1)]